MPETAVKEIDVLKEAKKSRTGAAVWLTRAANTCVELSGRVDNFVEYDSAVKNFDNRLASWDKAQSKVEDVIEEESLEEEIQKSADYREKMERTRVRLVSEWEKSNGKTSVCDGSHTDYQN